MRKTFCGCGIAPLLVVILYSAAAVARQADGLPAGSQVQVRLLDKLDTGDAEAGQTFSATVAAPLVADGRIVLASGTKIRGRVVDTVSSGRLKRPASITLELTQAGRAAIITEPLRIDGKSHLLRNVAIIGGETTAGAIVGAATGGKKGAAIGGAIGAGAGTATAYMTGKMEIVLPVETALTFVMASAGSATGNPIKASPDEPEASRDRSQASRHARRGESEQAFSFSDHDQQLIRRYFARNTEGLPPGLAKRGGKLPPGLERHLERDGTLPPGLQKRVEPFPEELSERLSRLPGGYARVILADRALVLDVNHRILDLMFIRQDRDDQGEDDDRDEN